MAFDAGMLRAVTKEISDTLCGGAKVERITQPARDEFVLWLHSGGKTRRLSFVVGTNVPHFSYSEINRENLPTPSMFCMLLRKHLLGAKMIGAEQIDFERAARFVFSARDEMGFGVTRTLVAEMMGKYSNLILLDGEERIISAFRIVDFSASRIRQVLPGIHYVKPPLQNKQNPLACTREELLSALAAYPKERTGARFLTDTFMGLSTANAHELAARAADRAEPVVGEMDPARLADEFFAWFRGVREGRFLPTLLSGDDGTPEDYTYVDARYSGLNVIHPESFSALFDLYFGERDKKERLRQRSQDLHRLLLRREGQLERKLEAQRRDLAECEHGGEYKRRGDLMTANIYRLSRGMTSFSATDYSQDPPCEVTVELDSRLSPAANAQKMYKLYTKSRRAKEKLVELIAAGEEELFYLSGVRDFLSRAEGAEDIDELRQELASAGYLARERSARGSRRPALRPLEFVTAGGYRVLVGRNNLQNDMLTFHTAKKEDLWFHAKGVGGSHVILVTGGEEPPAEDYTQAAALAAYYSQAGDDLTAVDYTHVKNVKKPPASRPGFVTYKTNFTAYVMPRAGIGEP